MVRIEVKRAREKDGLDGLVESVCNQVCEGLAEHLRDTLKDAQCNEHPSSTSAFVQVVATPNRANQFEINKIGFCCQEFEDSVNINIK